jgi:hypothetical protein
MDEQQRIEGVSIALRDVHETRERTDTHHTETNFVSRRRLLYNLHVPIRSTVGRRDSYDHSAHDVSPAGNLASSRRCWVAFSPSQTTTQICVSARPRA